MSAEKGLDYSYRPEILQAADRQIAAAGRPDRVTVILDDDPTGIQTIHGIAVYMTWDPDILIRALRQEQAFFIQYNTRSLDREQAVRLNETIIGDLCRAGQVTGRAFTVISRSDSTLRGHYPAETDAIRTAWEKGTGQSVDGELFIPFFLEGGRITAEDIHYLSHDGHRIPVAETEYARDGAFPYHHSDLKQYIEEKSGGTTSAAEVWSVSLDLLREGGWEAVTRLLTACRSNRRIIVNATCYEDLRVLTAALYTAERQGKRFLYRTAASFVKAYLQVPDRPLLQADDLFPPPAAAGRPLNALIIVGSHVPKTRRQLTHLLEHTACTPVPLQVAAVLAGGIPAEREIGAVTEHTESALKSGRSVVLYTSSALEGFITRAGQDQAAAAGNGSAALADAGRVSAALTAVVRSLESRPSLVITKGGITSSDIAARALGIRRCTALGQVLPGIPAVRCGDRTKWPGLPLIIFPGNVGQEDALTQICRSMGISPDREAEMSGNVQSGTPQIR